MLEGGVKADLGSQRFSVTAAGFRIRRTNVAEADARGFYRQIGEAASHGFEVEAVGSVARGLAIRGGYSWTNTEITRDTSGFVGRELPNAPRHKAQILARYRMTQGGLSGLMLAGGVVSVASQYTAREQPDRAAALHTRRCVDVVRTRRSSTHPGAGRTESDQSPLRDHRCRSDLYRGSITTCRAAADDTLLSCQRLLDKVPRHAIAKRPASAAQNHESARDMAEGCRSGRLTASPSFSPCDHFLVSGPSGAALCRKVDRSTACLFLYDLTMRHASKPTLSTRLSEISGVANDLRRELGRLRRAPARHSAVRDMAAFIKTEADAVIVALNTPPLPARRH